MNTLYKPRIGFCIFFILLTVCSCKKSFLDIVPKGKQVAETVNDYNLLFNNFLLSKFDGTNCQLPAGDEIMVFDPDFASIGKSKMSNSFLWEDIIYDQPNQDAPEMTNFMKPIYLYNKIINEAMAAKEGTDQQRKALKAEALANRAWCYLMLINYYGKPYNPATAGTDPGFPIITASDVTASKFSRASVQEVYDFIIKDLQEAIPDLSVQVSSKIRINKTTAQALLGKAYWYMGNYNAALIQFNDAFEGLTNNTGIPVRLYDFNVEMATGGLYDYVAQTDPLTLYLNGPTTIDDESLLTRTVTYDLLLSQQFVLAPWAKSLYGNSDQRIHFFTPYVFTSLIFDPVYNNADHDVRRFGPLSINFGMTLPDLYLMRAECNARLNHPDDARQDLELLRDKRMSITDAAVPSGLTGKDLVQFVLDERLREFAETGYRWFDMRRISVDPLFAGTTFTHIYKKSTGTQTFTLKPERLTFRFPQKVIDQNPGMENNP